MKNSLATDVKLYNLLLASDRPVQLRHHGSGEYELYTEELGDWSLTAQEGDLHFDVVVALTAWTMATRLSLETSSTFRIHSDLSMSVWHDGKEMVPIQFDDLYETIEYLAPFMQRCERGGN